MQLTLTAKSLAEARKLVYENSASFGLKAMVRCGVSLDVDGKWRVEQLKPEFQSLIRGYQKRFDDTYKDPVSSESGDSSMTESEEEYPGEEDFEESTEIASGLAREGKQCGEEEHDDLPSGYEHEEDYPGEEASEEGVDFLPCHA